MTNVNAFMVSADKISAEFARNVPSLQISGLVSTYCISENRFSTRYDLTMMLHYLYVFNTIINEFKVIFMPFLYVSRLSIKFSSVSGERTIGLINKNKNNTTLASYITLQIQYTNGSLNNKQNVFHLARGKMDFRRA
jgi:hypothetical protein